MNVMRKWTEMEEREDESEVKVKPRGSPWHEDTFGGKWEKKKIWIWEDMNEVNGNEGKVKENESKW